MLISVFYQWLGVSPLGNLLELATLSSHLCTGQHKETSVPKGTVLQCSFFFFYPTQERVNYKIKLLYHFCTCNVPLPSQATLLRGSWSGATPPSVPLTHPGRTVPTVHMCCSDVLHMLSKPGTLVVPWSCNVRANQLRSTWMTGHTQKSQAET